MASRFNSAPLSHTSHGERPARVCLEAEDSNHRDYHNVLGYPAAQYKYKRSAERAALVGIYIRQTTHLPNTCHHGQVFGEADGLGGGAGESGC
jgi:hypothetical protein